MNFDFLLCLYAGSDTLSKMPEAMPCLGLFLGWGVCVCVCDLGKHSIPAHVDFYFLIFHSVVFRCMSSKISVIDPLLMDIYVIII